VVVVSVEYRRSPEHRYPCGLDDVAAAYAYTVTTLAQEYNTVSIHTHRDRTAAPWSSNREGLIEVYYDVSYRWWMGSSVWWRAIVQEAT
jgi:hypothetical protein